MPTSSRILAATLVSATLLGCASSKVTSVRDPAFQGRTFQRVVVVAPFTDLDKRATAENAFVAQLRKHGVDAMPSLQVLPPTRTYTGDEQAAIMKKTGADGVLVLTMTNQYADTTYVPGQTRTTGVTSTSSSGSSSVSPGSSSSSKTSTTVWGSVTTQDPGYYVSMPRVAFEMRLVDEASGATAWLGTSFTAGDQFAGWSTLMDSLAAESVARMAADGVVR